MGEQFINIKDIKPGQKNINIMFIVLEIGTPTRTRDGHDVRSVKVADKTGSINISIWDETGDLLQTGDICRLTKGYSNVWKSCLTLYTGKSGEVIKVGEFCMQFTEAPNMSEPKPEYSNNTKPDQPGQRKSPTESSDGKSSSGPPQGTTRPFIEGNPVGYSNNHPPRPGMMPNAGHPQMQQRPPMMPGLRPPPQQNYHPQGPPMNGRPPNRGMRR
ncbi:SOSS complex subunit B2-like [Crassostrea virginica]|uniref:SOSS complex subunit B1-like n=1 Tax=Crassostrea virginica TaxID=6565 RepID=A0A8B8D0F3_CRAVI|nr:SOSS complex subunit B1-like [Crassostrea virginica]